MGMLASPSDFHHLHLYWRHVTFSSCQCAWCSHGRKLLVTEAENLLPSSLPIPRKKKGHPIRHRDGHEPQWLSFGLDSYCSSRWRCQKISGRLYSQRRFKANGLLWSSCFEPANTSSQHSRQVSHPVPNK